MTKDEALKLALEALESLMLERGSIYDRAITAIREALAEQPAQVDPCPGCLKGRVCRTPKCGRLKLPADHPLRSEQPAQQLEQEPCQCPECQITLHTSDCAVHNEPAYPKGACSCKAQPDTKVNLEAIPKQISEPVAWLHTKIEGVAVPHRPADLDKHPDRWEALYKTPPPCPTCEALARTVMLDQTYHDAQRKPLTDEEIADLWSAQIFHINDLKLAKDFVRAIEAAHGIKENK